MQQDENDILQSIHETKQIKIQVPQTSPQEFTTIERAQSIKINQICEEKQAREDRINLLESKKFSEIVMEEDFQSKGKQPEEKIAQEEKLQEIKLKKMAQSQSSPEVTQSMLQNYDKMMYQWRKIQRESLTKEAYSKFNKKPVQEDKQELFQKYLNEIISYLRAKFVYEELIEPIHIQKIINTSDITDLQYIYLLAFRAWCDINKAKQNFKKSSEKAPEKEQPGMMDSMLKKYNVNIKKEDKSLIYLIEPIFKMGEKIESIFDLYHKALTFKEKSFMNKLRNLKDYLFNYKAKTERDKILCGFEGLDFSRKQQVDYTEKYITHITKRLKDSQKSKCINKILPKIINYREIVSFQLPKIQGFDDFDKIKDAILKEWISKNGGLMVEVGEHVGQ